MTRYTGYLCPSLSPLLSFSFSHSLAPSHTHTQLQKYASKWQSSSAAADHRYCCCCCCIAAGNSNWQLLLRHWHAHRPSSLTPCSSECLKIHCTFKIEVQMLRNPHAKNARRSCKRSSRKKGDSPPNRFRQQIVNRQSRLFNVLDVK